MPKTLQIRFAFQTYILLFIYIWLYDVVVLVASFQVTKSSQSGDTVFGYLDDVNYATYTSTGKEQERRQRDQHDDRFQSTMLVPISKKPLLLVSSGSPLLSKRQCELLSLYYSQKTNHDTDTETLEGKHVLEALQKYLDELISRHEDTIVEPRYLFYDRPSLEPESQPTEKSGSMLSLWNKNLPDGLHVDTNNGKYFRYLTILVYLTDSHAATVFPLANLDANNNHNNKHRNVLLARAADYLIRNDIHHTRQVVEPPLAGSFSSSASSEPNDDKSDFYNEMIEDIKYRQALIENATIPAMTKTDSGVRVVPQQGHVAIFANIDASTGRADPYSFHGSELATDEKQVLTFFYEIPVEQFTSQLEFGEQVEIRLKQIKQSNLQTYLLPLEQGGGICFTSSFLDKNENEKRKPNENKSFGATSDHRCFQFVDYFLSLWSLSINASFYPRILSFFGLKMKTVRQNHMTFSLVAAMLAVFAPLQEHRVVLVECFTNGFNTQLQANRYRPKNDRSLRPNPSTLTVPQLEATIPTTSFDNTNGLASSLPTTRVSPSTVAIEQDIVTKDSDGVKTISMINAVVGLVKAMVGSGLLALASGLASTTNYKSGLYGAHFILIVLGIISAYTFSLYGRLVHVTQAKTLGELWRSIYASDDESNKSSMSSSSGLTVSFATFIFCFGSCIAYSLTFGDLCSSFIHSFSLSPSLSWLASRQASILLLTSTIVLPLCRLPSLAALAPASILGVLGTLVSIGFLAYRCPALVTNSPYKTIGIGMLSNVIQQPSFSTYSRIRSPAPLILVAMACVSYLAHFSAPDFYHLFVTKKPRVDRLPINGEANGVISPATTMTQMANDPSPIQRYNRMTIIGYITVAILNGLALTFGFLTFGGGSNGVILNNYSYTDQGATLSRLLVGLSVICSYPFVMCSCRNAAMELFSRNSSNSGGDDLHDDRSKLSNERRMTTILLSVVTAISLVAKDAGFVVGLNGAIMGSTIAFTFPALLFLRLNRKNKSNLPVSSLNLQLAARKSFINEIWICRSIIGFGIVSSIVGGITTIIGYFYPHLLR